MTSDEPRGVFGAMLLVRRDEAAAVAVSALYFFLLLLSYYILRPIRETMGVAGGVDDLRWLFLVTVAAMLLLNPVFGWAVSRWPRRVFVPATYVFFALNLVGFFAVLRGGVEADPVAARVFYVWVSVFNLFVVAVFWAFMADVWHTRAAKRVFPIIAVGGTIGAICGGRITAWLAEPVGAANLMLVSAVVLLGAGACAVVVGRRARVERRTDEGDQAALARGGAIGGLVATARSPYLLGVCGYMLAYTVTATLLYFQQAEIVSRFSDDHAERMEAFADIDTLTNVATLLLQLFVAGRVMRSRRLGVGVALAWLPVTVAGGFALLAGAPTLWAITAVQVARRAANYGLAKPARDALYTVLPRDEKYKAKAFIDTFVYRAGDAAGTGVDTLIARLGAGLGAVAGATMAIGCAWAVLALWLGRMHRRREAALDRINAAEGQLERATARDA